MHTFLAFFQTLFLFCLGIFDVLYPATLIFLFTLLFYRKIYKWLSHNGNVERVDGPIIRLRKSRVMLFLVLLILINIAIRGVAFFAGIPYSHRYFYPVMILLSVFAGVGMLQFVRLFANFAGKRYPALTEKRVLFAIIAIISISYSLKALHYSGDKKWIKDAARLVSNNTPAGEKPVIVSNYEEQRFAYYADAGNFYLLQKQKDNSILIRHQVKKGNDSSWQVFINGRKAFDSFVRKHAHSLFLIYRVKSKKADFSKSDYPSMKLIATLKDKRRKWRFYILQGK